MASVFPMIFAAPESRANWWAPAPLRRIYDRWGFSESSDDDDLVVRTLFGNGYRLEVVEPGAVGTQPQQDPEVVR